MHENTFRQLRQAACMTQAHLAKAAGVSERSVQRLEAGISVGAETIRAVCAVLGGSAAHHAASARRPAPFRKSRLEWSDELLDEAVAMWRAGMGGAAIAVKLGHGLSKNSVICKMYRLGMAFQGGSRQQAGYGATDMDEVTPYPHVGGTPRGGPPEPSGCPA